MADLFNQEFSPEIIKATDELKEKMGPLHVAAIRSGSVWASIRQAVNKAQSAGSIKQYMEFLLESSQWDGGEELLRRLRLHLNGGCIANWQLIAREHAAGIDYYVFPTLRDLIQDKRHWGLGLTETQLRAYVEPEEPSLWARIEAAIHHAQPPGRKGEGEISDTNVREKHCTPEAKQQDRSRALAKALVDPKVCSMYDDQVLPKTVATAFGSVSKDPDHEGLKAECLERAYTVYAEAKQSMQDQPMAQQAKTIAQARKQVREALEPIKRWRPKPLGAATQQGWAKEAAELLAECYTPEELQGLAHELMSITTPAQP